ncbi:substrate-binding periplasmic protein [Roseibium sp.]|uniref:substrate-binding periplasmic protein n=1 Tax=Roseibium sp. TaxID=1936156 RepID=UPI003B51D2BF
MNFLFSICLTISLLLSVPIAMADTFRVASPHLEGLVSKDGQSGMLVRAVTEIFERTGHSVEISVVPSRRVPVLLKTGKVDFGMPILEIEMSEYETFSTERSVPMIFRRDFVFVRKGNAIPKTAKNLRGKTLAATLGYGLDPAILQDPDIKISYTDSDLSAVQMVDLGHADAYISDEFVVLQAMKKAGIDTLIHNPERPMFVYGAALVAATPKAFEILPDLNGTIRGMWSNGMMQTLLPFNNIDDFRTYVSQLSLAPN